MSTTIELDEKNVKRIIKSFKKLLEEVERIVTVLEAAVQK